MRLGGEGEVAQAEHRSEDDHRNPECDEEYEASAIDRDRSRSRSGIRGCVVCRILDYVSVGDDVICRDVLG